jgi:hypothetical protein
MDEDDFELAYACLFCGHAVDEEAPDFCELDFTTGAGFGTFTCHVGCLRERSHDPESFPDIETPGEAAAGSAPPDPALLAAWDELAHALGHIHGADLEDAQTVRSLTDAITAVATRYGIEIEHDEGDEHETHPHGP